MEIYALHVLTHGWEGLALWFIPVFFFAVLISHYCTATKSKAMISVVVLLILGASFARYNINLPWTLSTVPFACVYMIFGNLFRHIVLNMTEKKSFVLNFIAIIGLIISFVLSQYYRLDMAWNKVLPLIPLLVAALSGIFFIIAISLLIERWFSSFLKSLLKEIGTHTYELLAFSQATILILNAHFQMSAIVKYCILIVVLTLICLIKDKIKVKNAKS